MNFWGCWRDVAFRTFDADPDLTFYIDTDPYFTKLVLLSKNVKPHQFFLFHFLFKI